MSMSGCDYRSGSDLHQSGESAAVSEEVLVASAKNGAHPAFVELCRRHRPMVFRVVHRLTRNREDAEDALQDSFIRAFTHLGTFDGRSAFSTWVTRIAINSALMNLRKKRNRQDISLESDLSSHLQIPHSALDPESSFLERERKHNVRKALRRLPPVLRSVAEIRYSREVTIDEIAQLLGISVSAAKSRLLRARKFLHRALSSDDGLRDGALS